MLNLVKEKCKENNVKLLFLTKFGSHLYGTDTPESDLDLKGIFLPSKEQCMLIKTSKSITWSSGKVNSKNNKNDIDIQLWSLQYFLELVSKGETNALDLLYSFTYSDMIIFKDDIMDTIFKNHNKLFYIKNCNAYIGYAIGQAKKYGIKGSRLGIFKKVVDYTKNFSDCDDKLKTIIEYIGNKFYDKSYCFIKQINGVRSLVLCGKVHLETIKISEFYNRIFREYKQYGERADLAEKNKGIDWKAISHGVRAIIQMNELIDNGFIQYPLKDVNIIKKIKQGKVKYKIAEKLISEGIEKVDKKLKNENLIILNKKDKNFIKSVILKAYNFKK